MRKGTPARKMAFEDMPKETVNRGKLSSKVDKIKRPKKRKTAPDTIVIYMDRHVIKCLKCGVCADIPTTHDYVGQVKPIVTKFKEIHSHE